MKVSPVSQAEALIKQSQTKDSDGGFKITTAEAKKILATLGKDGAVSPAAAAVAADFFGRVIGQSSDDGAVTAARDFLKKYVVNDNMSDALRKEIAQNGFSSIYDAQENEFGMLTEVRLEDIPVAARKTLKAESKGVEEDETVYYAVRLAEGEKTVIAYALQAYSNAAGWDGSTGTVITVAPNGNKLEKWDDVSV